MEKIILGLAGEIAAGKGTVAEYLKNKHDAGYHRFSTILRDIIQRLYLEETRDNIQNISKSLREAFGEDLLAKALTEDVKNDTHNLIIVDGVRRPDDIKYLQEISGFFLIYIETNEKIRFERLIKRSENTDDQNKTFKDFQKNARHETEQKIRELKLSADFTINNNGTKNKLNDQIDKILKQINL